MIPTVETARILRDTLAHYLASSPSGGAREALERIIREQAFTVLNRLAALRMTESRGILIESVGNGYQSKGFQLYERLAGPGLGETGDAYRCYLFSIFDEFALDLKVLFDRFSPQGRLFPRETAGASVLTILVILQSFFQKTIVLSSGPISSQSFHILVETPVGFFTMRMTTDRQLSHGRCALTLSVRHFFQPIFSSAHALMRRWFHRSRFRTFSVSLHPRLWISY